MSRENNSTDFSIDVEGLGRFRFARRKMRDVYRIRSMYGSLTNGFYDENGNVADISAFAYATIETLLIEGPAGFNLDALDPLSDDRCEEKIMKIFAKLRERESSFRPQSAESGEGEGKVAGEQLRTVVSGEVQPTAD